MCITNAVYFELFLTLPGGIFQLRQGQQRRIAAYVRPVQNSGMLPIICDSVLSISVGGPCVRSELQKPLDSYQEDDLNSLRRKWGEALQKRKEYLDGQITKYLTKPSKSEAEIEREQSLVEQVNVHFLLNGQLI